MKSLVEEASSVSKAIEKAWLRAGKPTSFSIKIYEEAQSGFLGFNSKPAKVGLFFEEQVAAKAPHEGRKRYPSSPSSYNEESKGTEKRSPHAQGSRDQSPRDQNSRDQDSRDQGPREKSSQETQRPSSNRRPRPQSFEKKEFDRNDRNDRPERNDRNDRPERNDRQDRSPRRRSNEQPFEKFEKKESAQSPQTTFIPDASPVKQPETQQPQQSSARRVLKVTSRRYSAPKSEASPSVSTPSSSDDDSSK